MYYYRVSAINAAGSSPYSTVVSATTAAYPPPANPSGLVAMATSQSQISLTWLDNSADETGFVLERGTSVAGPFSVIATTGANIKVFSDSGLMASTTYYYRLAATNAGGKSAYTSTVSAMTSAPVVVVTIPAMPATISVAVNSATQVTVSWSDSSNNETGFKIERATVSTGPFTALMTVGSGVTSYVDAGLTAVTMYYYRVSAINAAGSSAVNTAAAVTTFGTFTWIRANISTSRCLSCHTGAGASAGYDMSTHAGTLRKVVVNSSGTSLLYQATLNGSMPPAGGPLTTTQLNAIKTWIDSGALNN